MKLTRVKACPVCGRKPPDLVDGLEYIEWIPRFPGAPRRFKIMDIGGHLSLGYRFWFLGWWYLFTEVRG